MVVSCSTTYESFDRSKRRGTAPRLLPFAPLAIRECDDNDDDEQKSDPGPWPLQRGLGIDRAFWVVLLSSYEQEWIDGSDHP